eukprot:jgi/Botrbrau1/12801/Bobra.117_1s0017.2
MVLLSGKTVAVAATLTLATSSQGLLTTASKTDGKYSYNFATVPFLAELLKLIISGILLNRQRRESPETTRVTLNLRTYLLFAVPSVIYWLHNNVQFLTLQYVDPSTYQILGNLKIVTTGLLSWIALHRNLTVLQWLALILLTIGATTSQVNTCENQDVFTAPIQGYFFGAVSAVLSAVAAVYTEWVMKRNTDSLYWQNIQLYSLGVLFNGMGLTLADLNGGAQGGMWTSRIFQGYNAVTFAVVANLAFSGLLVSWVTKYADSIMKVYATSMAMFVTMVVSLLFFALRPGLQLILGAFTASISIVLYYISPATLSAIAFQRHSAPPRSSVLEDIVVKAGTTMRAPLDRRPGSADVEQSK